MNTIDNPIFGRLGESEMVDPATWNVASATYRCRLHIVREDDGTFSAVVLNLPGAGSCGDTEEEAVENAKEAIRGLVASYADAGESIPWKEGECEAPATGKLKWIRVDA